jgi:uncharacterized lipoprotein YddW (UPF0748 family)
MIAALAAGLTARAADDPPPVEREFRGAWIATVANIDWPSKPGLPVDEQQRELVRLLDLAVELKLNAVVFQVRPACDALYKSSLEPWSSFLTGRMGRAPQPRYDPLKFAVREAHRRGLELHAWFNPYRALHPSSKGPIDRRHVSRAHPEMVREYGTYLWLDPGEPAAVDHSLAVIMDVVERYDVDGVHFDDYFYPYPINDESGQRVDFPDGASWQQYLAGLDGRPPLARDDWRRANVESFLARLYRAIKRAKPWVKFGISPFGIYRPGHPEGIQGFDAYASIYADSRPWLAEPIVDYFSPQLYWPIDQKAQSYPVLLAWWQEQNEHGRHLWPGIFTSKIAEGTQRQWAAEEIVQQIEVTRQQPGATGNIHFSIKALAADRDGIATKLRAGLYAEPALVPASPWLAEPGTEPAAPSLAWSGRGSERRLRMQMPDEKAPWLWVVREKHGDNWTTRILPGHISVIDAQLAGSDEPDGERAKIVVSAVDRLGIEGPATKID